MHEDSKTAQAATQNFNEDDPRWRLVQKVLESRTFSKSGRLSSFLHFICLRTLEGRVQEVNEQQIGIHVFSRSPSYNPTDDSVVRTQARLLRQRLEEYFEHEHPDADWIIRIPKGGYVPVFERHSPRPSTETPKSDADAPSSPQIRAETKPHPTMLWIICALLAAGLIFFAILRMTDNRHSSGTPRVLWTTIFSKNRPTVIVPSDDALVLFQELTKTQVPLDDYLSGSYLEKFSPPTSSLPLTAAWLNSHQYTSIADLNLATRLVQLPEALDGQTETRYARDLRMDDLKNKNVILIGGIGANPWVGIFENQLNFDVNYDWNKSEGYVRNRAPHNGELPVYRESDPDGRRHNYGVLAFLPGIEGNGDALLFEGTGMAGTESAADFAFNKEALGAFAKQIGTSSDKLPHFEVLLETTSIGGNAPQAKVVAYRVINQ